MAPFCLRKFEACLIPLVPEKIVKSNLVQVIKTGRMNSLSRASPTSRPS